MVYWTSYYIFKFIIKVFFRGKCYNQNNLPKKGPFVGIINHNSLLDIPAMALVVRQRATTMVKHTLFEVPILGWWLRKVHMFPIIRDGSDQEAFQKALEFLKTGYVVYMAPEGTRKHNPANPPRARTGFVRLAQMADCPVVPIAIRGTRKALPPGARFPRFVKVTANVGKPIRLEKVEVDPKNRDILQQQATDAMQHVYRLLEDLAEMTNNKN
ncbi:1-acyl-sn-glycerol-3-phosphate acyltransferase [candidate division KSB1 bacterium]|nr:1-acyl-sn-glycerol-3-phosphate acyltransferase [candidate division KSB1 bacterium]NIR72252.1 1-acyl-sn-glycerol-3-phosphate acyltransferase [candidate division KSB1 bacterium]NIS24223.1 1-acyl-sn-glycerol-3-phosphate acyltransferase [candidate division KSB1 bacterium]NIT71137.1 1-acyl-sn-glycerol-3-phosphate acyltransferase [candidate division KSB1 bacterium]NIU24842.1 1-acyl-sn-glycerol-3-phosphate acyltransferase [candidate division KSB1 bacterium]